MRKFTQLRYCGVIGVLRPGPPRRSCWQASSIVIIRWPSFPVSDAFSALLPSVLSRHLFSYLLVSAACDLILHLRSPSNISLSSSTMSVTAMDQLTVAGALEIVKNSEDGQVHPSISALLERAIGEVWQRIQAQPTTYVMSRDEFAVFNYYRSRFRDSQVAQQAVARFWDHFRGDASQVTGGR